MIEDVHRTSSMRGGHTANAKVVVVTGVSSGIGLGTTKVLIENGFQVFGSVRKKSEADQLSQELGPNFVPLLMDITNRDAVLQARDKVARQLGTRTLAGLVNNAGVVVGGPLLYIDHDEYQRQLEVNMIAPLMVTQAFAPLLGVDRQREGAPGRIINISSTVAKIAIPFIGAYSASKAGLEGMSDALRRELIPFGIDVVLIEPGTVNTAMYDKAEREPMSKFDDTPYRDALKEFQGQIVAEGRKGLKPKELGKAVHLALTAKKPRLRYAVVRQRFQNWTLPRMLPARMLDAGLAQRFGLQKALITGPRINHA